MAVRDYNRHLTEKQCDNGSWDDNNMTTAFNLMRLVEAGVTVKDPVVEKGVRRLLSPTEPLGFTGLFILSEKNGCRFNAWKERQGGGKYLSSMFGMLDRLAHPLSAFLVLRSVPLLIREQRSDGFWHENLKGNCPPPKPEESTFIILSTLKRFNYLDALLPNRVKQRH